MKKHSPDKIRDLYAKSCRAEEILWGGFDGVGMRGDATMETKRDVMEKMNVFL